MNIGTCASTTQQLLTKSRCEISESKNDYSIFKTVYTVELGKLLFKIYLILKNKQKHNEGFMDPFW